MRPLQKLPVSLRSLCSYCNFSQPSIGTNGVIPRFVKPGTRIPCRRQLHIAPRKTWIIPTLPSQSDFDCGRTADRSSLSRSLPVVRDYTLGTRRNSSDASTTSISEAVQLASTSWTPESTSLPGKDRCPVYLLHGLLGFKEEFDQHGQAIADGTGHLVTALDARNHGGSDHTEHISYPLMADDYAGYMEDQGVRDAIVVAHSMGAGAAMCLALQQPERVRALFLIDSVIADAPRRAQLKVFMKFLSMLPLPEGTSLEEAHKKMTDVLIEKEIDEFIIRQSVLPNIVMEDEKARWRVNINVLAQDVQNLTDANRIPDLTGLTFEKPTYVLIGDSSDYVSKEKEKLIFLNFPRAQLQRVGNAGHWVHLDQPEIFLEAVRNFIRALK